MSDDHDTASVFIGFDVRETIAYHVLNHSILIRSSIPVSVAPIMLSQIGSLFDRETNKLQSTQFSFSRFLTPYLSGYRGWSLFVDCDMLMRADIAELFALRDDRYAVMCVKHGYTPKHDSKFLNHTQTRYEKKNWSSVMLFNNEKCRALTPEYVNTATGLELHQFKWLEDDNLIGEIPTVWNHLVGEYEYEPDAKLVHYTLGGPYFDDYKDCDFAEEWFAERDSMLTTILSGDIPSAKLVT